MTPTGILELFRAQGALRYDGEGITQLQHAWQCGRLAAAAFRIKGAADVDAAWQEAESTGEETPGGHAPTPDQDEVDEIGRAYGMEFQDNQELRTHDEVLAKRDRHRWEIDKRSTDESTGEI